MPEGHLVQQSLPAYAEQVPDSLYHSGIVSNTRPSRLFAVAISCATTAIVGGSCNRTDTEIPNPTAATASSSTIPPPGQQVAIGDNPQAVQRQLQAASGRARNVTDQARGLFALKDNEAACVAQRLDEEPGLRDGLGDDPGRSPHYPELAALAQDCVRITTGATNFANSIGAQSGGTLDAETLTCLRDAWAKLPQADANAIIETGLNPGSTIAAAKDTIDAILDGCKVDRSKLTIPGR